MKASLGEVREQAAHRFASEAERLQDQNETLLSAWSEGLKEELEQRNHRLHEQIHGEQLALEILLQRAEQAQAPLVLTGAKDEKFGSTTVHVQVQNIC